MTPATTLDRPVPNPLELLTLHQNTVSPWVSDQVLLSLSLWWVQMTCPQAEDMTTEVAVIFNSLQQELQ